MLSSQIEIKLFENQWLLDESFSEPGLCMYEPLSRVQDVLKKCTQIE